MYLKARSAAGRAWRSARAAWRGSAVIITYHRVADLVSDPQLQAVGVKNFAEHVEQISSRYDVTTAQQLFEDMLAGRRLGRRRVVMTFDDGYADNLYNARPTLDRFDVPATVYVTGAAIGSDNEMWWDDVERIALLAKTLPRHIEVFIDGGPMLSFTLGDGQALTDKDVRTLNEWNVTKPATHERARLYIAMMAFIRCLPPGLRQQALVSLREQTGVPAVARETHRTLTESELLDMERTGRTEIGAHTHTHSRLSSLCPEDQREEIVIGRARIEAVLGHSVRTFSYPYGGEEDYTADSVALVEDLGFLGACTTRFGITLPWYDRFQVPRCPSMNVPGAAFVEQIDRWFAEGR